MPLDMLDRIERVEGNWKIERECRVIGIQGRYEIVLRELSKQHEVHTRFARGVTVFCLICSEPHLSLTFVQCDVDCWHKTIFRRELVVINMYNVSNNALVLCYLYG